MDNNIQELAPIALFTYNRLEHTKRTIEAIRANSLAFHSHLFIFSDGPKGEKDQSEIEHLRSYLKTVTGFKSVRVFENSVNIGLAPSLIAGINRIFEEYETIIVFEDDIVCSPFTIAFLNDCLQIYKYDNNVGMIHGHIETMSNLPSLFFCAKSGCLGWASWKRAWQEVNFDGPYLLNEIQRLHKEKEFDLRGGYPYIDLLKNQIAGKNSSWAIQVYASFFLKNILTLYPGKSYIQHIGFDSGTHCTGLEKPSATDGTIEATKNVAQRIPVEINHEASKIVRNFYYKRRKYSLFFFKQELTKKMILLRNFFKRT